MSEKKTAAQNPGEELVTVELFKDNGKYSAPLFAAVNGETVLIERGVPVRIKRKFAWAIEQSQIQDRRTARLISEQNAAFERAAKALG